MIVKSGRTLVFPNGVNWEKGGLRGSIFCEHNRTGRAEVPDFGPELGSFFHRDDGNGRELGSFFPEGPRLGPKLGSFFPTVSESDRELGSFFLGASRRFRDSVPFGLARN